MEINKIHLGDCKIFMRQMEENSIPFIITDPPYLLEFMGKAFDSQHKNFEGDNDGQKMYKWHLEWVKEAYRVLKPGGFLVAFGGTRTSHRLAQAMEDAGFEIRDTICWMYGSGFPKSYNIGKGIDQKLGATREIIGKVEPFGREGRKSKIGVFGNANCPATPESQKWEGWGTALKPAYEPIIIGMKKLNGSFAENALTEGVAGINIDESRVVFIPNKYGDRSFSSLAGVGKRQTKGGKTYGIYKNLNQEKTQEIHNKTQILGRFPANVILSHHPDCKMIGYKKVKGHTGYPNGPGGDHSKEYQKNKNKGWKITSQIKDNEPWAGHADKDGNETIENWNCHPDCPVKILDKQSGVLKSVELLPHHNRPGHTFHGTDTFKMRDRTGEVSPTYGDSGGASRFFYTSKASTNEKNWKLEGRKKEYRRRDDGQPYGMNTNQFRPDGSERKEIEPTENYHPTVKPIDLMRYLVVMFSTPDGGIVYDPFTGSGSTLIACKILGRPYIGSEIDKEYYEIAVERLKYNWVKWWNDNKKEKIVSPETKKILNKFFDEE